MTCQREYRSRKMPSTHNFSAQENLSGASRDSNWLTAPVLEMARWQNRPHYFQSHIANANRIKTQEVADFPIVTELQRTTHERVIRTAIAVFSLVAGHKLSGTIYYVDSLFIALALLAWFVRSGSVYSRMQNSCIQETGGVPIRERTRKLVVI